MKLCGVNRLRSRKENDRKLSRLRSVRPLKPQKVEHLRDQRSRIERAGGCGAGGKKAGDNGGKGREIGYFNKLL
jgi:hypothetical protein